MPAITRVFVCSTYQDLMEERRAVMEAVRRLQLLHDGMEYFGARSDLPLETCLEEVRRSDILVVIVGHKYGSYVPDKSVSYSESEYEEGHRLGKPCLPYIRSDDVPILPRLMERDPRKMQALEDFKARLQDRHTVATFSDAADLALSVATDLGRTIQALESAPQSVRVGTHPNGSIMGEVERLIRDAQSKEIAESAILDTIKRSITSLLDGQGKRELTVFLSYAKSDKEIVRRVAGGLRAAGIKVWFDEASLSVGSNFERAIEDAIAGVDAIIFFISESTKHSTWQQKEMDQGILQRMREREQLKLIPVRLDETRVPALLRAIHYLDLRENNVDKVLPRLVEAIKSDSIGAHFRPDKSSNWPKR